MRILVMGGSYFAGRIFSLYTLSEGLGEITVLNRGSYPLKRQGIREIVCDRHDTEKLKALLSGEHFDAVVDFCAYLPGDINAVCEALGGKVDRYVFISTASVYSPKEGFIDEQGLLLDSFMPGETGEYIKGKLILEREIREIGVPYTILRPAIIYGPYNYAPRESLFIKHMVQKGEVPHIKETKGKWSFVYVTDIARAIHALLQAKAAENSVYNLAAPEEIDYIQLHDALVNCRPGVVSKELTLAAALRENMKLPFSPEDVLLYSGEKISADMDFTYTTLKKGMELTYKAFEHVYSKES